MNMATLVMTKVRTGWPTVSVEAVVVDVALSVDDALPVVDAAPAGVVITSGMMFPSSKVVISH
jgi:hypothetical protein